DLVAAQRDLYDTSSESLRVERIGYEAGKIDALHLIDAQRSYQQASLGLARAQAQRLSDSALLLVAVGGGWADRDTDLCNRTRPGVVCGSTLFPGDRTMRADALAPLGLVVLLALGCSSPTRVGPKSVRLGPCPDKPNCVSSLAPDKGHRTDPYLLNGANPS